MSAQGNDLTFRLGEPFGPEVLTLKNPDGTPTDLSGVTLTLVVREIDGTADLLTATLATIEPPTAGKTALTVPATGAQSVENLAAYAEKVLRYKVRDGGGNQVKAGWIYVAPAWGSV